MMNKEQQLYNAVSEAMLNSYKVIVEKKDPYDLIYEESDNHGELTFAHHIDEPLSTKSIDAMISWWEDEEEYEMCSELLRIKNGIKRLSKRNSKQGV